MVSCKRSFLDFVGSQKSHDVVRIIRSITYRGTRLHHEHIRQLRPSSAHATVQQQLCNFASGHDPSISLPPKSKPLPPPRQILAHNNPPPQIRHNQRPRAHLTRHPQPLPKRLPRTPLMIPPILPQNPPHQPHPCHKERGHKRCIRQKNGFPPMPCEIAQIPSQI